MKKGSKKQVIKEPKYRGKGIFAILDHPYPYQPGMIAQRIGPDLIGIYTVSETWRKYKLVARLDNLLQVVSGPPQFQKFIDKHYHQLVPLKPVQE